MKVGVGVWRTSAKGHIWNARCRRTVFLEKIRPQPESLDACIEAHCVQSAHPTVAPTVVRATMPDKGEEGGTDSELIFHIGGAGADLRVAFKQITAGGTDMDVVIPIGPGARRACDRDIIVQPTWTSSSCDRDIIVTSFRWWI